MVFLRALGILICVGAAGGCTATEGGDDDDGPPDPPVVQFETFESMTWSVSTIGGQVQISISDVVGADACALAENHRNSLAAAGHQIILRLPGTGSTEKCARGGYSMRTDCPAELGADAYVPEGCAYYRRFAATGASLGIAVARNGEITIAGDEASCAIRANVGFLGGSFAQMLTLTDGQTAQPWCGI